MTREAQKGVAMTDVTAEFFDGLAQRGEEPLLERATGRIRFDLVHGRKTEHWIVTITKGRVHGARENGEADCVVRMDKALHDSFVRGESNAMAATLRGALIVDSDPPALEVLMLFERLYPGPPPGWRADRLVTSGDGHRP